MTDFPDLKIKALVSFPASVISGAGIDVVKQNGTYQFNLGYGDFAPVQGIPTADFASLNALLWNKVTQAYTLTPITLFGSPGGIPDAPNDGTLYGRKNAAWVAGGGNVTGPATSTNGGFARWNGTNGTVLQDHAATISLASEVSGNLPVANLNGGALASLSTFWRGDGTWAAPPSGGGGVPSDANPLMDSVAAPGVLSSFSRADHVHPSDTTRAPLVSPALTGIPTAPTATNGTNTTQLATTAFVLANGGAGSIPATAAPLMDGVAAVGVGTKYAREDHVHPSDTSRATTAYVDAADALKAPLASPTFSGVPAAPTAAANTNTTQLATTAFVGAAVTAGSVAPSNANPTMDGAAAPGASALYARGDHIHPSDTSRVAKAGDTMTGNLTISKSEPYLIVSKTVTTSNAAIAGSNSAVQRWLLALGNASAESGSNAGSDFALYRYADDGSYLGNPLTINRSTGSASFTQALSVGGTLTAQNWININAGNDTGTLFLGNSFTRSLNFDGTSFNLVGGPLVCTGMTCTGTFRGTGWVNRAGQSGAYGGSVANMNWNGSATQLWIDTTNTGLITVTSDYRTKKDVAELPGMWEMVKALRPIKYTQQDFGIFVADDVERWGFIAHELQETLTLSAASGIKDAPDEIQSPSPMTVIAALTKALQEAMTRIEALEGAR